MSYFPTFKEIKEFRTKLGITQNELAKAAGVTTNMITQIETERAKPSGEKYKKIFEYLYKKSDENEIKLEEIMATPITFLTSGQSAQDAKEIFDSSVDFDVLPVLNNDKEKFLLGKISRVGLEKYLENNKRNPTEIIIKNILEESPSTFPHDTPKSWIRPFLQIRNSCVLVTKEGKITGIVNYWDYLSKI